MILTIAYTVLVTCLLGASALVGERICAELGWPRRVAWIAALATSVGLPGYALLLAPDATGAAIVSLPFTLGALPDFVPTSLRAAVTGAVERPWPSRAGWETVDAALVVVWAASSIATLVVCGCAAVGLGRALRNAETRIIDGGPVVVSERLGPAVFGLLRPRIVLPRWLAGADPALLRLVLRHEREHVAARDHVLVLLGLAAVALMPWNAVLWWQLGRLRAAIEMDCDARVLGGGADAREYSEALLTVRLRRGNAPLGAVALTNPVSELERRIRVMLRKDAAFSVPRLGLHLGIVLSLVGFSLALNAPRAQEDADRGSTAVGPPTPAMREAVYTLLLAAQTCAAEEDLDCAREKLDEVARTQDLNDYEMAQFWNFRGFLEFQQDHIPEATAAYENMLRLPDLPTDLHRQTLYSLSQLYFYGEQFQNAAETLDAWLALTPDPAPPAYYLRALIDYRLGKLDGSQRSLETAIASDTEPREAYYELRLALAVAAGDEQRILDALETLNARWPTAERATQLAELQQRGN